MEPDAAVRSMKVCVADAGGVFRAGVAQTLREHGFEVAQASTLAELEERVAGGIDVALVDEDLPPAGATAAIEHCASACPHIIVWSMSPDSERVLTAVRAGAVGYLRKDISPTGLVRSLQGLERGESPLSRDLAALMIDALHEAETRARAQEVAAVLSAREREVLEYVARGARNKQIAAELEISEFTVKRHVQNILQKLELPSRRAAATFYNSMMLADGRD